LSEKIRRAIEEEFERNIAMYIPSIRRRILDAFTDEFTSFFDVLKNAVIRAAEEALSGKTVEGETAPPEESEEEMKERITILSNQLKSLQSEVSRLQEEINRLYNLTEEDPKYQVYWLLRDFQPAWVRVEYISQTLNLPVDKVREFLDKFVKRGLVEIRGNEAKLLGPQRKI